MVSSKALVTADEALAQLNALLPEANAGDRQALAARRGVLDSHLELWGEIGNLARHA